jgi:hypothetical protein
MLASIFLSRKYRWSISRRKRMANKNTVKIPKGMKKVKAVKHTMVADSPTAYKPTVYMSDKDIQNVKQIGQKVMLTGKVVGISERQRKGEGKTCNYDIEIEATLAKGKKGTAAVKYEEEKKDKKEN